MFTFSDSVSGTPLTYQTTSGFGSKTLSYTKRFSFSNVTSSAHCLESDLVSLVALYVVDRHLELWSDVVLVGVGLDDEFAFAFSRSQFVLDLHAVDA